MANVLPDEKRLEGARGVGERLGRPRRVAHDGRAPDTIGRFGERVGEGCVRLHDRLVRDLSPAFVDMDEQHSWCFKRQQNVPEGVDDALIGEQWTWAALDRTSKLTIAWAVGKRNQALADELVADTRARLVTMPQITTDELPLYERAILLNFGYAVPYIQTVKNYSERPARTGTGEKYGPKRGVDFIVKRAIFGAPSFEKATTYAIERSNLTNRTWNARLNRRTIKFSKDLDWHKASMAVQSRLPEPRAGPAQHEARRDGGDGRGRDGSRVGAGELMEAALSGPAGASPSRSRSPSPPWDRPPAPRRAGVAAGGEGRRAPAAPAPTPPAAPPVAVTAWLPPSRSRRPAGRRASPRSRRRSLTCSRRARSPRPHRPRASTRRPASCRSCSGSTSTRCPRSSRCALGYIITAQDYSLAINTVAAAACERFRGLTLRRTLGAFCINWICAAKR